MIDEMRLACYAARVLSGNFRAASTAQVFDAATVGGAGILRRPDLGRIAIGCRADFSLVDLAHPYMRPVHDPLRSLVYSASERAIRDVFIDGEQVVRDGEVLTVDVEAALATLARAQAAALASTAERDWARRTVDEMSPHVFPRRQRVAQQRPAGRK
jgi:5-methylthioadenosine/S-adenosylhomocysteine deaminase